MGCVGRELMNSLFENEKNLANTFKISETKYIVRISTLRQAAAVY